METPLPNRRSIRKRGWDYTRPGHYFMTCNTRENRALFGTIVNGRMVLNEAGRVAGECWQDIPKHFPNAQIDEFVIMPNHVHGVLRLNCVSAGGEGEGNALGDVVGAYKAAVSRILGRQLRGAKRGGQLPARTEKIAAGASPLWHRNYWDVIVRSEEALANIRRYIRFNPQNYDVVMNVGEPQFLGNEELLEMPKMGFLASRGDAAPHGRLPVRAGEAILSGFLSPMERAVFKASLEHKKPAIWVKPWGLKDGTESTPLRRAIEEGRLLVCSPFSEVAAPSVRRAAWCNEYVLAHCDRMVVGHLKPDGMLACILSEAEPDMEITYL